MFATAVELNFILSHLWDKYSMKRIHLYLTDSQANALKTMAKSSRVSMSKLVRDFVTNEDPIRKYLPDGNHTEQAQQTSKIDSILRQVSRTSSKWSFD